MGLGLLRGPYYFGCCSQRRIFEDCEQSNWRVRAGAAGCREMLQCKLWEYVMHFTIIMLSWMNLTAYSPLHRLLHTLRKKRYSRAKLQTPHLKWLRSQSLQLIRFLHWQKSKRMGGFVLIVIIIIGFFIYRFWHYRYYLLLWPYAPSNLQNERKRDNSAIRGIWRLGCAHPLQRGAI